MSARVDDRVSVGTATNANAGAGRQRRTAFRILLIVAMVALAAAFFALDLDRYLAIATFKSQLAEMIAAFEANPILFVAGFMAIKITALALCLPGAVLTLALAGGAIFGFELGLPVVLTAMVIGDSIAFLVARYLARGWVERRLGSHVETVRRGTERNGAFYLLSLRLLAIIPFFIVNLAMGLTRMPLRVFAPVSFVGLLPATAIYVLVGTNLGRIDSPSDIYSPSLLIAFLLLALVPLTGAVARNRVSSRNRR